MTEAARSKSNERIEAKFVDGPSGPLFCVFASSENAGFNSSASTSNAGLLRRERMSEAGNRNMVLFVPPFGEEINLCRRFHSLLRTRLSSAGFDSVLPDLYGTGDSAGNFEEATLAIWQSDLEYFVEKFCLGKENSEPGQTLSIVALRAGCLFTQQLLTSSLFRDCNVELKTIVFIQPELNGFDIVNRLFRARIAAQRFSGNRTQSSADLWACIDSGETVHAGGYALSSELCRVLQHTSLELDTPTKFGSQVLFGLETGASSLEPASWEKFSMTTRPFWQSYDTEPEPALIKAIAEIIDRQND